MPDYLFWRWRFARLEILNSLYFTTYAFPENYIQVVRVLASKSSGMSQDEIIENLNLLNKDQLAKILKELIESDFVTDCYSFDRQQRETLYRLTDEYSQTKKQVFFTFMSTYGVVKNENWGMIDKELTLDALFSLA
jgi:uncharacterized protein